jgi:hypothetical protein
MYVWSGEMMVCMYSTGGVTDHMRKQQWGMQDKHVPPKGKLN